MLSACSGVQTSIPYTATAEATFTATAYSSAIGCENRFVTHPLPHTTSSGAIGSYVYTSNGSGLAIGDLNGDGRDDIALGNLAGPVQLLFHEQGLEFTPYETTLSDVRALSIVDVDGDGNKELVATRRFKRPVIGTWQNNTMSFVDMPNVYTPFYAMGWQDLNRDGSLDVVLGTYDTEQLQNQGLIFNQRGGGGVFVYLNDGTTFQPTRLNNAADALAIAFPDLNHDGTPDVYVGNDFNRSEGIWLNTQHSWEEHTPFKQTTENTMGIDVADYNNDGQLDIFATDMKPYSQDPQTMAMWLPAMRKLTRPLTADDPQYAENTLFSWNGSRWENQAYALQIDASGWSWSGKFGDLDNDGWQELYIVNGMIAKDLLDHLGNAELREKNMLFHNLNGERFRREDWGLSDESSGRSMSMHDFDNDGDLDVLVNPLDSQALLFENRMCGGASLGVSLQDPHSNNRFGIGATIQIISDDKVYTRLVRSESGYLSGDSHRVHVGLGTVQRIDELRVYWPDGSLSRLSNIPVNHLIEITKGVSHDQ